MPSPRGTNHERAFLPSGSRVVAAYDAAPEDMPRAGELLNFLADKLEPDDLAQVKDMLGIDDDEPASGASDAARRARARYASDAFPNRDRLK